MTLRTIIITAMTAFVLLTSSATAVSATEKWQISRQGQSAATGSANTIYEKVRQAAFDLGSRTLKMTDPSCSDCYMFFSLSTLMETNRIYIVEGRGDSVASFLYNPTDDNVPYVPFDLEAYSTEFLDLIPAESCTEYFIKRFRLDLPFKKKISVIVDRSHIVSFECNLGYKNGELVYYRIQPIYDLTKNKVSYNSARTDRIYCPPNVSDYLNFIAVNFSREILCSEVVMVCISRNLLDL